LSRQKLKKKKKKKIQKYPYFFKKIQIQFVNKGLCTLKNSFLYYQSLESMKNRGSNFDGNPIYYLDTLSYFSVISDPHFLNYFCEVHIWGSIKTDIISVQNACRTLSYFSVISDPHFLY
jgi:hypothetical protein